ncbi:MAG: aminotransferase class I/II-fold pyridoxal phosphate-dependent enzyme [Candidatus Nealsonbacteria bacterium]|nr:aminotransferase class I/II-fold pyridoxal phosphate-dependent enzyme [Candidatus Nealsonbacteria bacterium]
MKQRVTHSSAELAIFGGDLDFREPLHVGRPNLGSREAFLARINDMLDRDWLTNNGPFVREFEQRIADMVGVKHCVAMCNATIALEIVTRALELTGEVIVPSFTFIATAHALQWQQITPVFCDIDPRTHTIDPARVEELITPRTTGIIGVHTWGHPCDVEALTEIARRRGLTLMFDAAHAFGCTHQGQPIGRFGAAEVFSFHATKFFNSLEGGAVMTNDDDLAAKMRLMKNFGFAGPDNVVYIGTNGKMTEVSAAMGLTSLESLEAFRQTNRGNYEAYRRHLQSVAGLRLMEYDDRESNNFQYIILEVDESACGLSRDQLQKVLQAENVLARRYFHPGCHRMEPYRSYYPHAHLLLPATESVSSRVLVLPTGTSIGSDDIETICQIIATAIAHADAVKAQLATTPEIAIEDALSSAPAHPIRGEL